MASPSLLRSSKRPDLYVCGRCAFRAGKAPSRSPGRWLHLSVIKKRQDAEMNWQAKAAEIRAGKQKSMLTILEERGLVHTITGSRDVADKRLTDGRLGVYVGIDPTASSLHVGHLLPLMSLFWMYAHGYKSVVLLGGATAKIGDPTDRLTTREAANKSVRTANMVNMHYQLKKLMNNAHAYGQKHGFYNGRDFEHQRHLVNNNFWWNKLPLLEVLTLLGHSIRMGPMLAKDTVKNKMQNGDGMSFAEFTYPLMQAWDWWHLYNTLDIHMQIGGADQYGNITAGLDAVKHIAKTHHSPVTREDCAARGEPFGFTVPLLTTSSGAKFGKSAGNAVWLDNEQTSVFDLYGYFLRTSDADVGKYLKLFTFISIEEIDKLVEQHMQDPSRRIAQHTLARELIEIVHGVKEAKLAEEEHRKMYGNKSRAPAVIQADELETLESREQANQYITLNNRPQVNVQLPASIIHKLSIGRILFAAGLAVSASEGHRLAQQQAVYIGGMNRKLRGDREVMLDGQIAWTRVKTWVVEDTAKFLVHGDLLMLRRGKNMIKVIQVVPDEEYDRSGKSYPGQKMPGAPPAQLDIRSQKVMENLKTRRGGGPYGKPHHGAWKELREEDFSPERLPEEEKR